MCSNIFCRDPSKSGLCEGAERSIRRDRQVETSLVTDTCVQLQGGDKSTFQKQKSAEVQKVQLETSLVRGEADKYKGLVSEC